LQMRRGACVHTYHSLFCGAAADACSLRYLARLHTRCILVDTGQHRALAAEPFIHGDRRDERAADHREPSEL